jgi:hypothetical protein
MRLLVLPLPFAVVRLPAEHGVPWWAIPSDSLLSVTRTPDETTVVCEEHLVPDSVTSERDFRCLRIEGPLPFSAVGVLASLTGPLAAAGIPILALSTYDTDYVLVRSADLQRARTALSTAGLDVGTDSRTP